MKVPNLEFLQRRKKEELLYAILDMEPIKKKMCFHCKWDDEQI